MLQTLSVPSILRTLDQFRYPNGLFAAARWDSGTGYHRVWIRDNVYIALCLEKLDPQLAIRTYHGLLDLLLRHERKIEYIIKNPPLSAAQYLHPRYDPDGNEVPGDWGNKQHDAIGILLFAIGKAISKGMPIIRSEEDARVLQKLVFYLDAVEYWQDADHGIWEDAETVHASSLAACVAGLRAISQHLFVPSVLITRGEKALQQMLPRESALREVDMALLSLIYPLDIADATLREEILKRVEDQLVRNRGVIRHTGDWYYARNGEAEWPMGFAWLTLIYKQLGNRPKEQFYRRKLQECLQQGMAPELYYAHTDVPNGNTPLAWTQAMLLAAEVTESKVD